MTSRYSVTDLTSENLIAKDFYEKCKKQGFDVKNDFKTFKITPLEYREIISDLTDPACYPKFEGRLEKTFNEEVCIRKIRLPFRKKGKRSGLRVIALVIDPDQKRIARVFPFHMYPKNFKTDLKKWEYDALKEIIGWFEKKGEN